MKTLNTLTNKEYDNEFLFLTPTNYGIDDLVDIIVKPGQETQAILHALDELHNRGITKLSRLLEINLNYPIDEIKRRISEIEFEADEQWAFPQSLNSTI